MILELKLAPEPPKRECREVAVALSAGLRTRCSAARAARRGSAEGGKLATWETEVSFLVLRGAFREEGAAVTLAEEAEAWAEEVGGGAVGGPSALRLCARCEARLASSPTVSCRENGSFTPLP